MQPHHQLPRIPLHRLTTSDSPSELPPLRSRPMFIPFKPSNLSSRPFTITNPLPQFSQLDNNNTLTSLRRPLLEQGLPTIKAQSKCQFCNESFDADQIISHVLDCEMQKITCDKCGDRVPIQIYDIHYEECAIISHRMEAMELRSPIYRGRIIDMDDDDDDSLDEGGMERGTMYLPESGLSYEELLRLDETVVKKGMTEEEMEKFRVQLYVKSLDGEGCCNICLSDYETAEYTRELSCKHKFHRQCIDKWLEANITCPMCKKYFR